MTNRAKRTKQDSAIKIKNRNGKNLPPEETIETGMIRRKIKNSGARKRIMKERGQTLKPEKRKSSK